MTVTPPVRRLRFTNKFTGLGVRHILAVAITISACIAIGAIEACAVLLAFICRMILFVVFVFLFAGVWIGSVVFSRLRFSRGTSSKFVSHKDKDKDIQE